VAQGAPGTQNRAMKAEYDPFSEENLAQIRARQQTHARTEAKSEAHQKNRQKKRKSRNGRGVEFLKLDLIPLLRLSHKEARGVGWRMFFALSEAWFTTGICTKHLNPFPLSLVDTKKWNLNRSQKSDALQFLIQADFIKLDRSNRKNPVVTLLWVPSEP
jgi:hypothetical protein